jgi:hypothetical protein
VTQANGPLAVMRKFLIGQKPWAILLKTRFEESAMSQFTVYDVTWVATWMR